MKHEEVKNLILTRKLVVLFRRVPLEQMAEVSRALVRGASSCWRSPLTRRRRIPPPSTPDPWRSSGRRWATSCAWGPVRC